jgi:hypothetical protein
LCGILWTQTATLAPFLIDRVSADGKLTRIAEVKLTHLGKDGGFLRAVDAESGASSGDTSAGPSRVWGKGDRAAAWVFAEHG